MAFCLCLRQPRLSSCKACPSSTMAFQASESHQRRRPRRYLIDAGATSNRRIRRLSRSGIGFGGRTLPGISNCLRALAFDEATAGARSTAAGPIGRRQLAVITFEVDDQWPEDLAAGLDHIRDCMGFST